MRPGLKSFRTSIAVKLLKSKRKKINKQYFGLTASESRKLRRIEILTKNRDISKKNQALFLKNKLLSKKIPVVQKNLNRLIIHEEMLTNFLKKNEKSLSPVSENNIKVELGLTRINIANEKNNLAGLKKQLAIKQKNAINQAKKIRGKK